MIRQRCGGYAERSKVGTVGDQIRTYFLDTSQMGIQILGFFRIHCWPYTGISENRICHICDADFPVYSLCDVYRHITASDQIVLYLYAFSPVLATTQRAATPRSSLITSLLLAVCRRGRSWNKEGSSETLSADVNGTTYASTLARRRSW